MVYFVGFNISGEKNMKTGLVLEGGASRTIFTCGILDALLEKAVACPGEALSVLRELVPEYEPVSL